VGPIMLFLHEERALAQPRVRVTKRSTGFFRWAASILLGADLRSPVAVSWTSPTLELGVVILAATHTFLIFFFRFFGWTENQSLTS
jgi:hypothetical protein